MTTYTLYDTFSREISPTRHESIQEVRAEILRHQAKDRIPSGVRICRLPTDTIIIEVYRIPVGVPADTPGYQSTSISWGLYEINGRWQQRVELYTVSGSGPKLGHRFIDPRPWALPAQPQGAE